MATQEELRSRITAMRELRNLVRIMRALAAVKSRVYAGAAASSREYADVVSAGLQVLLRELPPGLETRVVGTGPGVVVAFGSDQGMCGAFNRRVAARVGIVLAGIAADRPVPHLVAVGLRLARELEDAGCPPDVAVHLPAGLEGVVDAGRGLLKRVDGLRREAGAAWVRVVHHRPAGPMGFDTVDHQIVPLDPGWLRSQADEPWPSRCLPMTQGPPAALLVELVRQHLFVALFRAFAESMAAENSARLSAMEAASRSVDERLENLDRRFHAERQRAITEELLDVTAGFEVLEGEASRLRGRSKGGRTRPRARSPGGSATPS